MPGILIAVGAAISLAMLFPSVGSDFYNADTKQEVLDVLADQRAAWNFISWMNAVSAALVAIGLGLLGAQVRDLGGQVRVRRAGTAIVVGAILMLTLAGIQVFIALASDETLAKYFSADGEFPAWLGVIYLLWSVGATIAFVALGLSLIWTKHQRWLGWIIIILGPIAALVLAAVMGGTGTIPLLLLVGITMWASPVRDESGHVTTTAP
jgi:hypothetical protein